MKEDLLCRFSFVLMVERTNSVFSVEEQSEDFQVVQPTPFRTPRWRIPILLHADKNVHMYFPPFHPCFPAVAKTSPETLQKEKGVV